MKVDPRIAPRTRSNETAMRNALAATDQARVAELLDVNGSTISRMKDTQIEFIAGFLAAVGLKAVEEGKRFYSDDRIRAMNTLAKVAVDCDEIGPPDKCHDDAYRALKTLARIALDTEGSSQWGSL